MVLYYKMRQILLQNATAILLQNATKIYYKMRHVFYYKMRQFYYKMRQLLQNATFITNCDGTYCFPSVFPQFPILDFALIFPNIRLLLKTRPT